MCLDIGHEEIALFQDPSLSVCLAPHCLFRLLLGQLHIVVPEVEDPLVQQAIQASGAASDRHVPFTAGRLCRRWWWSWC